MSTLKRHTNQGRLPDQEHGGTRKYEQALPRRWPSICWATIACAVLCFMNTSGNDVGRARIGHREKETGEATVGFGAATKAILPLPVTPPEVAEGRAVFVKSCAPCHQADGGGLIGPNLTDRYWLHGGRPSEIYRTVRDGVVRQGMPAYRRMLSPRQLSVTVAYVQALRGTKPQKPKGPQGMDADSASTAAGRG